MFKQRIVISFKSWICCRESVSWRIFFYKYTRTRNMDWNRGKLQSEHQCTASVKGRKHQAIFQRGSQSANTPIRHDTWKIRTQWRKEFQSRNIGLALYKYVPFVTAISSFVQKICKASWSCGIWHVRVNVSLLAAKRPVGWGTMLGM